MSKYRGYEFLVVQLNIEILRWKLNGLSDCCVYIPQGDLCSLVPNQKYSSMSSHSSTVVGRFPRGRSWLSPVATSYSGAAAVASHVGLYVGSPGEKAALTSFDQDDITKRNTMVAWK